MPTDTSLILCSCILLFLSIFNIYFMISKIGFDLVIMPRIASDTNRIQKYYIHNFDPKMIIHCDISVLKVQKFSG